MKYLTEAEHADLIAAREQRDHMLTELATQPIEDLARKVVDEATRRGIVLTIEQEPLQPLAMGNHRTVISTRFARKQI